MKAKVEEVNEVRNIIKTAAFEQENFGAGNKLEAVVQSRFRDWLMSSGHIREIADLIGLEKTQS